MRPVSSGQIAAYGRPRAEPVVGCMNPPRKQCVVEPAVPDTVFADRQQFHQPLETGPRILPNNSGASPATTASPLRSMPAGWVWAWSDRPRPGGGAGRVGVRECAAQAPVTAASWAVAAASYRSVT